MEGTEKKIAIGIDLGTTNCCVAVYKNGVVDVIPNRLGDFVTPSWVAYKDDEVIIGKIAKENAHKNVRGTLYGIKRIIGRKYTDPTVQEVKRNWLFLVQEDNLGRPTIEVQHKRERKHIYPEEVSALVLREIKEDAEAFLGEENLTDVVITVPAYFNDHQRQATKDAARIAGLNVLRLINEPTAAAIAYVFDKPEKQEHNVLVYDFGGGTFDVSIISLKENSVKVKATRGDTNLGGENFDQNCIDYFTELIKQKFSASADHTSKPAFLARLKHQVEKAKHSLSSTFTASIEIISFDGENDVDEEFTRARFDELNNDLYENTMKIVEQCVKEAGLKNDDIDDVVLVGGSTRVTKIEEMLKEVFSEAVSKATNPDHAVARGAAVLAASLNRTLPKPLNILDVIPMSLGIETLGNEMNVLIERNSQIPTEAKRTFTTGVDGQDGIEITILEGDSQTAKENLQLGRFTLLNLPEDPSVDVTFQVDINGILTVEAIESSSGICKTLNVTLQKGRLTEGEIGQLSRKSVFIVEENKKWTSVKGKRNMLESYLLQVKTNAKKASSRMSTIDKDLILHKIETSLSWLKTEAANYESKVGDEYENVKRYSEKIMKKYV